MDLHVVPGVNAKDVADAHSMDVLMEKEHSCKCLTYWIDELRGYVFCLIDAPDQQSVVELHTRAHGLVPNKIIEVEPSLVNAFLGRITDPENTQVTDAGLKILDDTSYRVILQMQLVDPALLKHTVGLDKASTIFQEWQKKSKEQIFKYNGRQVSVGANEITASFIEGGKAFFAAMAIAEEMRLYPEASFRVSLHAGEPVMQSDQLFGDTVQLLKYLNFFEREQSIAITAGVAEILSPDVLLDRREHILQCKPKDETFINGLFEVLNRFYPEENFGMEKCGQELGLSASQLNRKTNALFGLSPNQLLRNFRLHQALIQLRVKDCSIAQVSFDTGFSSPSYFTKCFKDRYGLLPLAYQDLVSSK